jgi:succinoglycan biosynthesis transport protein ExoP
MRQHERALDQETSAAAGPQRHLYMIASLLRRWKVIVFSTLAALAAAALFLALKPVAYTATTQLLIYNRDLHPGPEPVISPGRADTALVENMIEIFKSRTVLAKVIETLKLNEDSDAASTGGLSQIIRDWMALAPPKELSEQEKSFERSIEHFRQALRVTRAGTSHTVLVSFTSSDPRTAAAVANEIAASAARLFKRTEQGSSAASPLRERLQGVGPSAYVISEADPPVRPDAPRRVLIAAVFLLAGFGLGTALALLLDSRDRTIRTSSQLKEMLDLECFGTVARIPRSEARGSRHNTDPPGLKRSWTFEGSDPHPRSLSQALRRALTVSNSILAIRTLGVTSTDRGEGATTVAAGLAQVALDAGKTVLLISVTERAGAATSVASTTASSATTKAPGFDTHNIDINETEGAFNSNAFDQLRSITLDLDHPLDDVMQNVAPDYDRVIIDLPPLSPDTATQVTALAIDGILLALPWGRHSADDVRQALDLSGIPPAKFAGVILNFAPRRLIGRYGDVLAGVQARLGCGQASLTRARNRTREQHNGLAPV